MKHQEIKKSVNCKTSLLRQLNRNVPNINHNKLDKYQDEVKKARSLLIQELKAGLIPALNIAYDNKDNQEIKNLADKINEKFETVLVLGVGGSSLGGKTLTAIKNNPNIKIYFLESIDSETIKNYINKINLQNTLFLVISKSGETIETTCQTLIFIDQFKRIGISNLSENFLFITQSDDNTIAKIAKKIGAKIYLHPKNIGGRFSYLTIVGLLPSALAGLDLTAIKKGARNVLDKFITENPEKNLIFKSCVRQLYLLDKGFDNNVIMPYIDSLKDFTDWYRQLWAESLGKKGFGSTPINSMGTIDQHSQLQLYLDGPKDKFFTFIIKKNCHSDFIIKDLYGIKTRFGGKNLGKIVAIEQNTTIEALKNKKSPIRILELNKLDEETLSTMMMQMFLETIIIAKAKNIDPFDQPAVEFRKELTKKYL